MRDQTPRPESRLDSHLDTRGAPREPQGDSDAVRGVGVLFDGRSSRRRRAKLRVSTRSIRVTPEVETAADAREGASAMTRHKLQDVKLGERWQDAPLSVLLPDGSTVWVDAGDAQAQAFTKALVQRVQAARWRTRRGLPWPGMAGVIASWPAVGLCLMLTLALLTWFDRQGASMVATRTLQVLPVSIDERIGDAAWDTIEGEWLTKSEVPDIRQLRLTQRFRTMATQMAPDRSIRLEFHRMRGAMSRDRGRGGGGEGQRGDQHDIDDDEQDRPLDPKQPNKRKGDGGFNAFALPNGTIVLLDGLTNTLNDDEVMSVLGHELGHVVHRHSMKGVMRSAGLLSVASVVFGDFSSVIASSVASLQTLHYSREDEREADQFGYRFAEAAKLPPGTEASVWRKFQKEEKRAGGGALPGWLSTHPSSDERLKAAEGR